MQEYSYKVQAFGWDMSSKNRKWVGSWKWISWRVKREPYAIKCAWKVSIEILVHPKPFYSAQILVLRIIPWNLRLLIRLTTPHIGQLAASSVPSRLLDHPLYKSTLSHKPKHYKSEAWAFSDHTFRSVRPLKYMVSVQVAQYIVSKVLVSGWKSHFKCTLDPEVP